MTVPRKADAQEIINHLDLFEREYAADQKRKNWPRFLFHFTDVNNAVKILDSGAIYSRAELKRRNIAIADAASPDVLQVTDDRYKEHVRLYFRPRTPTQYRNEGIRPIGKHELNSHCPVPVMMLFDANDILTRQSTCFSDGNLAAGGTNEYCNAEEFKKMPFEKIYHTGWQDYDDEVKRRRNAEVIIPTELDLSALKGIRCRSQADLETLRNLLSDAAVLKWQSILGVDRLCQKRKTIYRQLLPIMFGEYNWQLPPQMIKREVSEICRENKIGYPETDEYYAVMADIMTKANE